MSVEELEWADQCPSSMRLFPASVRHPLRNMVKRSCPRSVDSKPRKLTASQFQVSNIVSYFQSAADLCPLFGLKSFIFVLMCLRMIIIFGYCITNE